MSSYQEFQAEKQKIDQLYEKGYVITHVHENLSGAFITFERPKGKGNHQSRKIKLHILTADGRKYFSNLIIARQKSLV
ncbi:hypothetical protein [Bacillus sp. REN10]|uniref:hypothetical protein n=1 Tax=Bacillus sp. REN10 TaxID=2782541 RepID=UPI00193BCD6B|nr:hypothetical protein [Bacillus sp. REN10]